MRSIKYTFLLLTLTFVQYKVQGQAEIRNSVLATGTWYKIAVTEEGIYEIDASFLQGLGINTGNIDPRNLRIFGNGGRQLPQANEEGRFHDLQENAILVAGEEDGSFDAGDRAIFYATGPDTFTFDTLTRQIHYSNHAYSDTSFYFLTISESAGQRLQTESGPSGSFPEISSFVDFRVHEADLRSLVNSGRHWFGEAFTSTSPTLDFSFTFPNLIASCTVTISSDLLARSFQSVSFDIDVNGNSLTNVVVGSVPDGTYSSRGREVFSYEETVLQSVPADDEITISLNFNPAGNVSTGYLDYLLVSAERSLVFNTNSGPAIFIQSWETLEFPMTRFLVQSDIQNPLVMDITDPTALSLLDFDQSEGSISWGTINDRFRRYCIVNPSDNLPTPIPIGVVPNQNIQGAGPSNLIIISHPNFLPAAEQLADLRRTSDKISVKVVTSHQIFNEFSSGSQDVSAIRDYLKYLWDIDPASESGVRNALLFGRGSFDYKNRKNPNTNFVPIYESENSVHPIFSYSSDDYYGFLENTEGEWLESTSGDHSMDIGIGRIPVTTLEEANTVVDKYIQYANSSAGFGSWKNKILFVADDEDGNLHQRQANMLSDSVERFENAFNSRKLFLDAFPQQSRPGGESSVDAYDYLLQAVNNGTFLVNFTGHGNELQWTEERILDLLMIDAWNNESQLPIFVTATCEFGRHDDPARVSGGEKTLLKEGGGAIALVTTARPVFASQNFELNKAFYEALFNDNPSRDLSLGEVFLRTKNKSLSGSVNRNFSLLGDPSVKPNFPDYAVRIDSINGSPYVLTDTLSALEHITLTGSIRDFQGNHISDFNGQLEVTLFEKATSKSTLGNRSQPFQYTERDNAIFRGLATITSGLFQVEMIIPKSISYQFGTGKFSFYAFSTESGKDAAGADDQIVIGSSVGSASADTTPPTIQLFLGDTTFTPGDLVKPDVLLIGKFYDDSGINISSSGLGQDIVATLDETLEIRLGQYYVTEPDNFRAGTVIFPLTGLKQGSHTLTLRAWDVYNNAGSTKIEFLVSEKGALVIQSIRNSPNPFVHETEIELTHNRPGEDLEIMIQIVNSGGEVVNSKHYEFANAPLKASGINWNGRNSSGQKLTPGVYYIRAAVRSLLDGASGLISHRIIIY